MHPTYRLPASAGLELAAQAAGERAAVEPRDAASVILVRDGSEGPELYLLKRHRGMAFAGGMAVFPGGSVDASDAGSSPEWIGPPAAEWAETLNTTELAARGVVIAAVRELFEETGVLLAGSATAVVGDSYGDTWEDAGAWEEDRRRLEAHEISFTALLALRGLAIRTDLLKPWAKWITPQFESRRYATWFFVAGLPADQSALGLSTEAQSVEWSTVDAAIAAADAGDLLMLPPQYYLGLELSGHATVADILAEQRDLTPVAPVAAEDDAGFYLVLPPHLVQLADAHHHSDS